MTIVGVMPRGFWLFPWASETDAWSTFNAVENPGTRWFRPIGRLRRGATLRQAQAEMDTLFRRSAQQHPDVFRGWGIRVESLHEWAVGGERQTLYLLLGAVGFVLSSPAPISPISCSPAPLLAGRKSPYAPPAVRAASA